jgi:very-short-patch-repair endonuclease
MEITNTLLKELQKKLKVGNKRGVHLNAIPSRSRYKLDLNRLKIIRNTCPKEFVNDLLSKKEFDFSINWSRSKQSIDSLSDDEQRRLLVLSRSFENLINQTETIELEKGINTFGFGFPLLIRKDASDGKLTVAPILIWSLRIKRDKGLNAFRIIRDANDPIYLNEVLINHLENDSKLKIDAVPEEMLEDDIIDKGELAKICFNLLSVFGTNDESYTEENIYKSIDQIKSISEKTVYEKQLKDKLQAKIDFCGLFSIFEVQKQSVINDYVELIEADQKINFNTLGSITPFQSISSVQTDPSQQGVLNSLGETKNILIQGPPGTGKSQTLTAVLVNALENHKKVIVVCEKRTALEVLENALKEKGLDSNVVLIKDVVKDRKIVIDSVRSRVDSYSRHNSSEVNSKNELDRLIRKINNTIVEINGTHKKIGDKVFDNKTRGELIGRYLKELKKGTEQNLEVLNPNALTLTSNEYYDFIELIQKGELIYNDAKEYLKQVFINVNIFQGENSYELRNHIDDSFMNYESSVNHIHRMYRNRSFLQKIYYPKLNDTVKILKSKIKKDNWIKFDTSKNTIPDFVAELRKLVKQKNHYFDNDEVFENQFHWFTFYNKLSPTQKSVFDNLRLHNNWENTFNIYYLNLVIKTANPNLSIEEFKYMGLGTSLSSIKTQQLRYIREYWHKRQVEARKVFNRDNEISVVNLYNKRKSSKNPRLSLRKIVKKDKDLFTDFFPIILTTPDVCSTLFKGDKDLFDIVLFDEASQLRVEENLPAMLKGKQIIVAGDEHQMPPSSYFSKVLDGTVEDEDDVEDDEVKINTDNILLECESLLEFAVEMNFEKQFLDFHYRSRHHYLIDFSNHAFYNKRLIALPNNLDYKPIEFYNVGGSFINRVNEEEADRILTILKDEIHPSKNGTYPSVGIATFNISQRDLIQHKILEQQSIPNSAFAQKLNKLEEGGLFIKNLENIQGDERDIIILSITYGKSEDGKFYQRFGPVNHQKGYKLLNVIITRAKDKIYVCNSIPEEAFLDYNSHLITEQSNNRKAVFYAYLAYCKAVSEKNENMRMKVLNDLEKNSSEQSTDKYYYNDKLESPFEEEVYQALAERFGEKKLVPQYQFAGFRVDIVYEASNGIKIAIECDGAKYHSSREAYLYDRHRQTILENHGFVFHRIWSTNWWKNHKAETNKLIQFIGKVENRNDASDLEKVFS